MKKWRSIKNLVKKINYHKALLWNKFHWLQFRKKIFFNRFSTAIKFGFLIFCLAASFYFSSNLQILLEPYFFGGTANDDGLNGLRSVLLNTGTALIGATAVIFSLILFVMQINIEKMPYGIFRQVGTNKRLFTIFLITFFIAITIACLSLIPSKKFLSYIILAAFWLVIMILELFFHAYKHALKLINPSQQLKSIAKDAKESLQTWSIRAKRSAPLLRLDEEDSVFKSTNDSERTSYFIANPHWTNEAKTSIQHAIYFVRKYAEHGDHEVSNLALKTIIEINQSYILAKGKTFYAVHLLFDNPLATDGFINNTIEHLRQNLSIGIKRGDEYQIEQTLKSLADLTLLYLKIEYGDPNSSKYHAHLASGYLCDGVEAVLPHNMPDVVMEGTRLIGEIAQLSLAYENPNNVVTLTDKLQLIASVGVLNKKYKPVTLTCMQQLTNITMSLFVLKKYDIHFPAGKLKQNVFAIAKLVLSTAETPLINPHSTYLSPYYSHTGFSTKLKEWVNIIIKEKIDSEAAGKVINNIEKWAEDLYQPTKELLLEAVNKESSFTFDIMLWITDITECLIALANVPSCKEYTKSKLERHAAWLVATIDWLPDNDKKIAFLGTYKVHERIFELAIKIRNRDCPKLYLDLRKMLLDWGFKAGKYQNGWGILENSLYGIVAMTTLDADAETSDIIEQIKLKVYEKDAPNKDILEEVAKDLKEKAETLRGNNDFQHSLIDRILESETNLQQKQILLKKIADILSPIMTENKSKQNAN